MLNPRGSPVGRRFWEVGGGVPLVLRFPGVVKGVNGPWELRRAAFWPVTGDWKGWEGGTRFGSREEEEDALWAALCVPGAVKGAGSKGRWGGTRVGSREEEDAWEPLRAVGPTRDAGPCLFHELVYVLPLLFPLRDGCVDARGCCGPLLNGERGGGPCLFHEVAYPLPLLFTRLLEAVLGLTLTFGPPCSFHEALYPLPELLYPLPASLTLLLPLLSLLR